MAEAEKRIHWMRRTLRLLLLLLLAQDAGALKINDDRQTDTWATADSTEH